MPFITIPEVIDDDGNAGTGWVGRISVARDAILGIEKSPLGWGN